MKQSHYVTPRTMSQGEWHESGEAIHGFPRGRQIISVEAAAWCAVVLFAVSILFARLS